jgi:glycosyltransferase involved in cell wall biosynthesis
MEIWLFTSYYPHNFGDTVFIKPEIPFLSRAFKKVHVTNMLNEGLQYKKVEVPANLHTISLKILKPSGKHRKIKSAFSLVFHPFILVHVMFFELRILLKQGKINFQVFVTAIRCLLNAILLALYIKQYLLQNPEIKIIYTYWFKNETLAALICKKYFNMPIKCITRVHGCDLYEFVQKNNYQPYKKWMDKYIDRIFFASKAGHDYYIDLFAGSNRNKYVVAKLGIENPYAVKNTNNEYSNGYLNIVSCSFMVPGKRIHLIIEALSNISGISIKWVHIGDGAEKNKLLSLTKKLLDCKKNISYNFLGLMNNDSIKTYYARECIDIFVSTTASEGGNPVSMMEAISFGIPIISSNVGGVCEIVNKNTGILLDPDNCVNELVDALHHFSEMTAIETETLRKSCRKYWENYNAETQYTNFLNNIINLN